MKTDTLSSVGVHAFEVAGLGKGPFRFIGMGENVIRYPDGTTQAGGSCDYCGTGIRFECLIQSADGVRHKVGSDCINKVGDSGLYKAFKTSPEYRAHQRKLRQAAATVNRDKVKFIMSEYADKLRTLPHPRGFSDRATGRPLTAYDQAEWLFNNCGASGMVGLLRWLATVINQEVKL